MRATQACAMRWPVATEPVKLIALTRLSSSSTRPIFGAAAHHQVEHSRWPARAVQDVGDGPGAAGTRSAGLSTTTLPQARAGVIFQAGIAMGKFQGVIRLTTPTGSRVTSR